MIAVSSSKRKSAPILLIVLLTLTLIFSSCYSNTSKMMYPIGTEWTIEHSSFVVVGCCFQPSYQTVSSGVISPASDCEFIVVECRVSLDDNTQLEACSVKKSDVYADSHPLFGDPIFLTETLTENDGNCVLLFPVPTEESSYELSSYSMNICISVDGKSYSKDFSFS